MTDESKPTAQTTADYKVKDVLKSERKSAFRAYRDIYYGDQSLWHVIKAELIVTLTAGLSGALGLALRKLLYPSLFGHCGKKVVFGKNLTLRHAHKITLGNGVILDDNVVIDAKGESNRGIQIGDDVYIGRNTIVYCKNGDITLGSAVNISSNCQLFSCNAITIGDQTMIAAFTYVLSGGQYDLNTPDIPFAEQSGTITSGPTVIGSNCWLGAHVVVVDGVTVGHHAVLAAGAVVAQDVEEHSLVGGVPAKVMRKLESEA